MAEPSAHRNGHGATFQITSLFPKLTVLDNVLLAIQGLRRSKFVIWRFLSSYRDVYDKAHGLLERASFLDRRGGDTEVRYLSHGEQRQLEIVLALASDPSILLLDEPAAGLSSGESAEMAEFLLGLDANLAILLIEHDMDVVFDVAHHISVLHFGEVLEAGPPRTSARARRCRRFTWGRLIHGNSGRSGHPHLLRRCLCVARHVPAARARADSGLLGRNGVGKTTLVNSIVGFTPPRRGKIVFKGADITRSASFETVRSGMGLVPQGRRVFPTLSVEENLVVAERNPGRHGWNLERVYALSRACASAAASAPRRSRARAADAGHRRGLMTNPDCLIMDEPSEGLAPSSSRGCGRRSGG